MKKINVFFQNFYKWKAKDFFLALGGILLSSVAINYFIVPNHLYNGGVLGISQLIRSGLEVLLDYQFPFDISGLISFLINVPLFIIAYKYISKTFFRRTILCVVAQTVFLTLLPIPKDVLLDDLLTCVLIGGILGGFGGGMTLSASASGGGTDIIGVVISMRNKKLSVGRIQRAINLTIYGICGVLYGLPTMIYSVIYAVISSLVVDHTHKQNICSYVMVFTKNQPDKIIQFVRDELVRDATYWEAIGGFDRSKTYITYSAMTKYELQRFERHLPELEPSAFVVKSEGVGIDGNFAKNLTD